jgi:hypothetical protein
MVHGDPSIVKRGANCTWIRLANVDRAPVRAGYGAGAKRARFEPHFKIGKLGCSLVDHGPVLRDLNNIGRTVLLTSATIEHKHDVQRSSVLGGAMAAGKSAKKHY